MIEKGTDISHAANVIRCGGLVAFPTETVYGLGANAFNPVAVARIFEVKKRPVFDPLIVHISDIEQITKLFAQPINPLVYKLAKAFWPGPLTIVHNKNTEVPDIVTSGLGTVAVRMPSHPIALELIKLSQTPVAAPSANRFGMLSPTKAFHVEKQLTGIDYLITSNNSSVGIESTVISVHDGHCMLLRPGGISIDDIQKICPCHFAKQNEKNKNLPSPGLLKSHYSPNKPLYIIEPGLFNKLPKNSGIILHKKQQLIGENISILTSETGILTEVAANLFSALHAMEDNNNVLQIYIESVEEHGLGIAIMDRIKKAAYRYV